MTVMNYQSQQKIQNNLTEKRLIICHDRELNSINHVVLAFHQLLNLFPKWLNQTALVLFTPPSHNPNENVYFLPNLDKDLRSKLLRSASINIDLNSTAINNNSAVIPTLTNHTTTATTNTNQINISNLNLNDIAYLLNTLLSTQRLNTNLLVNAYKIKHNRLFLFDYDGTLTPIVNNPADALPSPALLKYLEKLCQDPSNTVWIISGRDQHFLDTHLGHLPHLGLSAEHGSFMKRPGCLEWIDMLSNANLSWKTAALNVFQKYTPLNPGTVIEEKKSSITWHYRNALNVPEAIKQSSLCRQELLKIQGADVLLGKMNVEIRSHLVNKGHVVKHIQKQLKSPADFIMCVGDDRTDEDMFQALQSSPSTFCISVGPLDKFTLANYCIEQAEDVVNIIGHLVSKNNNKF